MVHVMPVCQNGAVEEALCPLRMEPKVRSNDVQIMVLQWFLVHYTKSERLVSATSSLIPMGSKVWLSEETRLRT